jgi:hypothetical protein
MATDAAERTDLLSEPDGLYEVIDGRVVEKPMGAYECWLAAWICKQLDRFLDNTPLGRAVPDAGPMLRLSRSSVGHGIGAFRGRVRGPSCRNWRSRS